MVVVGIDLGTDSCVIAVAQRGGIEVLANEFSRRYTPTVVSLTEKERVMGENALNISTFNAPNTIHNITRVIGLKYSQLTKSDLEQFTCKVTQGEHDEILFEVSYQNQTRYFTPIQVLAMMFTKLKINVEKEVKAKGVEAVIVVPAFYNDRQRRHVVQAAEIAHISVVTLVNSIPAAAVEYAMYRAFPEKEEEAVKIAFLDVGHASTIASIVSFTKSNVKVSHTQFDANLGAKDFENVLLDHLIEECKKKYKLDVRSNIKATLRLGRECEKLKKMLGVNPVAQIRLECFMNDIDVSFQVSRDDFETMSEPVLAKFPPIIQSLITASGVDPKTLTAIEVIGGGSYIPSLRRTLSAAFGGQTVSTTLNSMESIGRGAAFLGAMITPYFQLTRHFTVTDCAAYAVSMGWKASGAQESMDVDTSVDLGGVNKSSLVFKQYEPIPSSKLLTFNRNHDFDLYAMYANPEQLPARSDVAIAKFRVIGVPKKDTPSTIKIKVRLNRNCVVSLESAELHEEVEVVEEVKPTTPTPAPATDGADQAAAEPPKPETRKVVKTIRTPLQFTTTYPPGEITPEQLKALAAAEQSMVAADNLIAETAEAKNSLEAFIYTYRDKIEGDLAEFIDEATKEKFNDAMNNAEEWLYGEGEETTKEKYVAKLDELQKFSAPAERRRNDFQALPTTIASLQNVISSLKAFVGSQDEKYAHITAEDREKVSQEISRVEQWLASESQKQQQMPKSSDPMLTPSIVAEQERLLKNNTNPILNKPKPAPPKPEEKKAEEAKPAQPAGEEKMDTSQ